MVFAGTVIIRSETELTCGRKSGITINLHNALRSNEFSFFGKRQNRRHGKFSCQYQGSHSNNSDRNTPDVFAVLAVNMQQWIASQSQALVTRLGHHDEGLNELPQGLSQARLLLSRPLNFWLITLLFWLSYWCKIERVLHQPCALVWSQVESARQLDLIAIVTAVLLQSCYPMYLVSMCLFLLRIKAKANKRTNYTYKV